MPPVCRARIGATVGAFFNQSSHSSPGKSLINEYIQTIPHDGGNRNIPRASCLVLVVYAIVPYLDIPIKDTITRVDN